MLIGLPNREGGLSMTLFGNDLNDAQAILDAKQLGDLRSISDQPYQLVTVTVDRLHGVEYPVVLLGDAAHAVLPFYGQGMNSALEDCLILDDLVDHCFSWQEVFEALTIQRMPDLEAIRRLAELNYESMSHGQSLEDMLERALFKETVYEMVSFTQRPYREAWRQHRLLQSLKVAAVVLYFSALLYFL